MERPSFGPVCPTFRTAPAPGALYLTEGADQALNTLTTGIAQGQAIVVLTGDSGTGKTTMIGELVARCGDDLRIGRIGQSGADTVDLPHWVLAAFGARADTAAPLDAITAAAVQIRADGQRMLLVIDEAQTLTDGALTHLEQMIEAVPPGTLYVLLAGGPDLSAHLARPRHEALRRRIGTQVQLSAFAPSETAAYVAHRFRMSGCACHAGVQVFDDGALQFLHRRSGGIARVINTLAQRCLFEARITNRPTLDEGFVRDCLDGMEEGRGLVPLLAPTPASPAMAPGPPVAAPVTAMDPTPPDPQATDPEQAPPRTAVAPHRDPTPLYRRSRGLPMAIAALAAGIAAVMVMVPAAPRSDPASPIVTPPASRSSGPDPALMTAEAPSDQDVAPTASIMPVPDAGQLLNAALAAGVDDPAQAARLYASAALWGNERAAYYLGQLHETGIGVEADPQRARAWYQAAPSVTGAQARLADLPPPPPPPAWPGMPVPTAQVMFDTGMTELHWRVPDGPGPARFAVEFASAGPAAPIARTETDLTALLLPVRVSRWRVLSLDAQGHDGPASDWSVLMPPAR